jgi:hypothetical protein
LLGSGKPAEQAPLYGIRGNGMGEVVGVRASVLVRDDHAVIPDLAAIESLVSEVL